MLRSLALGAFFVVLAVGCEEVSTPESTAIPTGAPASPQPTPTDAPHESVLPAVIDASELFVAATAGQEPVLVHTTGGAITPVSWSPDGERLAFGIYSSEESPVYVTDGRSEARLAGKLPWSVDKLLWSPSAEKLAAESTGAWDVEGGSQRAILVVDASGGPLVEVYRDRVSRTEHPAELVSWLPGGEEILLVRRGELMTVNVLSKAVATVASGFGQRASRAALTPDGSSVAVVAEDTGAECGQSAGGQSLGGYKLVIVRLADKTASEPVAGLCGVGGMAWSPDGRALAYAVYDPREQRGTYFLDIASGSSRRLAASAAILGGDHIQWLADGSALSITRCYEGCYEAAHVPIDGSGERKLLELSRLQESFGGFAPDSRRYVYSDEAVRVQALDGPEVIVSGPSAISAYTNLSWAPLGDRLTFVRMPDATPRLYEVDVTTGDVVMRQLPSASAKVSPDGQRLAFLATADPHEPEPTLLWLASVDGTERQLLVDSEVLTFAWSPDGRSIAYAAGGNVGTVEIESGSRRKLSSPYAYVRSVTWSPDGKLLALMSDTEILVLEVDSDRRKVEITRVDGAVTGEPSWSPDSRSLVYVVRDAPDRTHLVTTEVETGERRALTRGLRLEADASWSPDGTQVAFWGRTVEEATGVSVPPVHLYRVSLQDGEEMELVLFRVAGDSLGNRPVWSPMGEQVAVFAYAAPSPGVFLVRADGSSARQVIATGGRGYANFIWSRDGNRLFLMSFYQGL